MKTKTKNRLRDFGRLVSICLLIAVFFFIIFLSVGSYGQMRETNGLIIGVGSCKKAPDTKTSYILPKGDTDR